MTTRITAAQDGSATLHGNIVLTREAESNGTPLAAYVPADPGVMRHVSHFATCPNAAQHRK
jgi:hypothetical protein